MGEFPEWLVRSISRIKEVNNNLKSIAEEKRENRMSLFQGKKNKNKKKNDCKDDDTVGPRDCDIGIIVGGIFSRNFLVYFSLIHFYSYCGQDQSRIS